MGGGYGGALGLAVDIAWVVAVGSIFMLLLLRHAFVAIARMLSLFVLIMAVLGTVVAGWVSASKIGGGAYGFLFGAHIGGTFAGFVFAGFFLGLWIPIGIYLIIRAARSRGDKDKQIPP